MNIEFIAKGIKLTEDIKSYVEHKLKKFETHLAEVGEGEVEVIVTLNVNEHRQRHRADLDVYLKTHGGGTLHAWEESNDIYMSLEFVIDDILRQLGRLKERRLEYRSEIARQKAKSQQAVEFTPAITDLISEEKLSIAKPISVEEALMILQDEDRFFLAFRNADSGEICVIYRKKTGKYGLISP